MKKNYLIGFNANSVKMQILGRQHSIERIFCGFAFPPLSSGSAGRRRRAAIESKRERVSSAPTNGLPLPRRNRPRGRQLLDYFVPITSLPVPVFPLLSVTVAFVFYRPVKYDPGSPISVSLLRQK